MYMLSIFMIKKSNRDGRQASADHHEAMWSTLRSCGLSAPVRMRETREHTCADRSPATPRVFVHATVLSLRTSLSIVFIRSVALRSVIFIFSKKQKANPKHVVHAKLTHSSIQPERLQDTTPRAGHAHSRRELSHTDPALAPQQQRSHVR